MATIAMLVPAAVRSQPAYTYEVVSIRRAAPGEMNSGFGPGAQGGMRARNVTPLQALAFAYSIQDYQVDGLPGWAKTERFEISFTPDRAEIVPGRETPRTEMDGWLVRQRQRMQAVLRDRFSLVARPETRELPTYILTVSKNGPKLDAPKNPQRGQTMNINNGQRLVGTTATMKALAESLAMVLSHPVRDETGLDGAYDFAMEWAPADDTTSGRPSIFTALTEKLGLRLEAKKGPVPVLVIEKIERPSEN